MRAGAQPAYWRWAERRRQTEIEETFLRHSLESSRGRPPSFSPHFALGSMSSPKPNDSAAAKWLGLEKADTARKLSEIPNDLEMNSKPNDELEDSHLEAAPVVRSLEAGPNQDSSGSSEP